MARKGNCIKTENRFVPARGWGGGEGMVGGLER